jgi:GntR family transcriptional regulator
MSSIERNSPVPLYHQLKELLSDRISNAEWQAGDMLPTEEQLTARYGLSRTTVRQALRELELEGLISRHRGRGTFVSRPKLSHSPDPHHSLTDFLLQQGRKPGWRVLSAEWLPAPAEAANGLQLEQGTAVFSLRRLRLADEEPIGYHVAYVSSTWAAAINTDHLEAGGSLHYLNGQNQLAGSYADRTIEAIPAPKTVAEVLAVEKGSPLLMIHRLVIGRAGKPVEELRAMYRGDRFQYQIRHLAEEGRP